MIIDGKLIAKQLKERIKKEVSRLPFQPVFCDILVGEDSVSASYVNMKAKACEEVGMKFLRAEFPSTISQSDFEVEIDKINNAENLCGLIIQLPLPSTLNKTLSCNKIKADIDVDCLNAENIKKLYLGDLKFVPPTPGAVLEVLNSLNLNLNDKHIVVVGQGELVGKPVTFLLKQKGFHVSVADKSTQNITELTKSADVLITATGKAKLIKLDWVKQGVVVIDAGAAEDGGSIVGDVDFEAVKDVADFITPVPGGLGPVTVVKLLENVLEVAKAKA